MPNSLSSILDAAHEVRRPHILRDDLVRAGHKFWSGLLDRDELPADLQERADQVVERILARGSVEATVSVMSDEDLAEAANAIVAFAEEIRSRNLIGDPE